MVDITIPLDYTRLASIALHMGSKQIDIINSTVTFSSLMIPNDIMVC